MTKTGYDSTSVESKWQQAWDKLGLFQNQAKTQPKNKQYLLFAFAYPSGLGLHVGHVESMTALDILARYYRMLGKDVYFPVGWDAFGLPAENYAIQTGVHPAETTKQAIETFRGQIKRLGITYDWANEIATSHPEYYRWTQWLFLKLYEKGLAYRGPGTVNWCPQDQTVLANEQVVEGRCERCGTLVEQKELEQWYFKITDYKDELLSGLEDLNWPAATKQHQRNWIGKSEGALIRFPIVAGGKRTKETLEVFSTAHDTIFGCTFMVCAPEHPILGNNQAAIINWDKVAEYQQRTKEKTELDRQIQKEKTGVKVEGIELENPLTGDRLPLFVADYVLAGYGTGAIMAVPGHDERDGEFAKAHGLPMPLVAQPVDTAAPESELIPYSTIKQNRAKFTLINSGKFDGQNFTEGQASILQALVKLGFGEAHNQYKLRDWLISRQRYWGAPIPIVYDPEGKAHPVKEEHLPWLLPTDVDFKPTGESPLKSSKEFIARTEKLYGKGWRPEFDTMDTFVDSSWYFLRYADARNTKAFADPAKLKAWLPVDLYLIGPEHIVLHLLYARFFTKFLRDEKYLTISEPFTKMRHQGMILGPNGKKMSKSKGNVINPDEIIGKFGADTLRVYEMFMGPLEADKPWDPRAVAGVSRFLGKIYANVQVWQGQKSGKTAPELLVKLHQTIKKTTDDLPALKFNTAIAAMMEFVNLWHSLSQASKQQVIIQEDLVKFLKILAPLAPFMAEELYAHVTKPKKIKSYDGIHVQAWPEYDAKLVQAESITLAIQVDGKVRGQLSIGVGAIEDKTSILKQAKAVPELQKWLEDKKIVKEIYVPGRIVSFVTR